MNFLIKHVSTLVAFASMLSTFVVFKNLSFVMRRKDVPPTISNVPRIPKRIIMTAGADNFFEMGEPHKSNSMKTIVRYEKAWESQRQGRKPSFKYRVHDNNSITSLPDSVWYLNDDDCIDSIDRVEPRLLKYFLNETEGKFRADLCRLTALYEQGGYYFDTDMEVVRPVLLSNDITFVSITSPTLEGKTLFQSFMAVAPHHPILRINMDKLLEHYYLVEDTGKGIYEQLLGPEALYASYAAFQRKEESKFWPSDMGLTEAPLSETYPRKAHGFNMHCQWLVHNASQSVIYFYSRAVGVGGDCKK